MTAGKRGMYIGIGVGIAMVLTALSIGMLSKRTRPEAGLAAHVDMSVFDGVAVHTPGRFKSFESFAHERMGMISGRESIDDQPRGFTYLDMLFREERYFRMPVIQVKNKPMRAQLAHLLAGGQGFTDEDRAVLIEDGLVAPAVFQDRAAQEQLTAWSRDIIKTAKHAERIFGALNMAHATALDGALRIIPVPGGDARTPWVSMGAFMKATSPGQPPSEFTAMDPALRTGLREAIGALTVAWSAVPGGSEDPAAGAVVTARLGDLASLLRQVNPGVYPSESKLAFESRYFRYASLTWVWVIYLFAVMFLLMAVVYRWEGARNIGMGLFSSAAVLHTVALAWRWYASGRWPNSNMFEAVTTSVWFGVVVAFALEVIGRRSALRNFFALGGSAAAMAAMMAATYSDKLDPNISNMMPVLHDLWLYIHTNVIIASYALIAMASVTALLYLLNRLRGAPADYARVGGTGMLLESDDPSVVAGLGPAEVAPRGVGAAAVQRRSLGEVLDGATLVLMELSIVMLWAGIGMGAIWADHSWGRPWGWDPKEVFALNTLIVFIALVHVRLKVRDKGLWTALLAVVGCGVMLFNWIVINFVISGLHSYA